MQRKTSWITTALVGAGLLAAGPAFAQAQEKLTVWWVKGFYKAEDDALLAALLEERTELKNHSGFSCDTLYHPVDAIHAAAVRNYNYEHWVKDKLEAITGRFDLKYWPSLGALVQAIADDADHAAPLPHDPVTEAGTAGNRAGLADTFRAFFVALEESSARNHGLLPSEFELTDRSTAILVSCALGLGPDKVVDSTYVKRLRQRQREKA